MMLLAAVVLILAFLALSAMVSRVSQLASSTTQEQDRPIQLEVAALRAGVDDLIVDLQAATPDLTAASDPTLDAALEAGLRHLASLESARGLSMDFGSSDAGAAFDGVYDGAIDCGHEVVWIRLGDGEVTVELAAAQTFSC